MKRTLSIAAMALVTLGVSTVPALANHYNDMRDNQKKAMYQRYEAQREAFKGDFGDARHHMRKAARDEYKARRDGHRALRGGYWY